MHGHDAIESSPAVSSLPALRGESLTTPLLLTCMALAAPACCCIGRCKGTESF